MMKQTPRQQGFTLIELMVVVTIIAILAAIAIPNYQNYLRKSRRSDAQAALSAIQQAQERFRANCTSYAAGFVSTAAAEVCDTGDATKNRLYVSQISSSGGNYISADGYYLMSIPSSSATGYTILADATSSVLVKKQQSSDNSNGRDCRKINLIVSNGTTSYQNNNATPAQSSSISGICS